MKRILLFTTLLIVVLGATACGSDDEVTTGDSNTTVPDTTDPDTTAPDTTAPDTTKPDQDLPIGGGSLPIADLEITITHPDAEDVSYRITCLGDTATITGDVKGLNDFTACERLGDDAVRQRLVEGPPTDQACTEQYGGPDIAKIVGTYDGVDGVKVNTTVDRTNGCGISDWDDLLAGVLPTALGITDE